MKRNQEITALAEDIMVDITNSRIPLHNILLKASRLSLLLDIPDNITYFKERAVYAEQNQFVIGSFNASIEAAQDKPVSISSANPDQYLHAPMGNAVERNSIRIKAEQVSGYLARYRAETYNFASSIYSKWQFGNIAESIFEKKRSKSDPELQKVFPDINERLNSIEQNLGSTNSEDWKSSVVSCRTLLADIADVLNPAKQSIDKDKYINRLKDYISPKIVGGTKGKLLESFLEELKMRLELTSDTVQGSAHKVRPSQSEAEDIVLYTYLIISELMTIYAFKGDVVEPEKKE